MKTVRELLNEIEECRREGVEAHLILDDVVRDLRALSGGCPNGPECCDGCKECVPACPLAACCRRGCQCFEPVSEGGESRQVAVEGADAVAIVGSILLARLEVDEVPLTPEELTVNIRDLRVTSYPDGSWLVERTK